MSDRFTITIDDVLVQVTEGQTILQAAHHAGIDIPTLCYLEQCGPLNTCQVCLVKLNGRLVPSCGLQAQPGMVVESETVEVHDARRTALELLFSDHVGDCLSPCQRLCPLELNIPVMIRQIRARDFTAAGETVRRALPLPAVLGRLCHHPCEQGCRRGLWDEPAAIRDMELKVSGVEVGLSEPGFIQASSGRSVVIVGSGPSGLAAAWQLARQGHVVTVVDRQPAAGGSLRRVAEDQLPRQVLDEEVKRLQKLGITFKLGLELGEQLRLEGLLRGFNAVLLATGECTHTDATAMGVEFKSPGVKVEPGTGQTSHPDVFAVGAAVRPVKHLVRAMAAGRAVADSVHRHLLGRPTQVRAKSSSSVIGRLAPGELKQFLQEGGQSSRVSPCEACAGFTDAEAQLEGSRCLHCDCRSSGACGLQHWAQVYTANANRFRSQRPVFEQERQPGGILFEPGKCILCGICVKLCEQAQEALGLTFVGRGFDVRVSAAFGRPITEGLREVGALCVEHCPTGALVFDGNPSRAPLDHSK